MHMSANDGSPYASKRTKAVARRHSWMNTICQWCLINTASL
jgi:hypothetical protein